MIVTNRAYNFKATVVTGNNQIKEKTLEEMMGPKGAILFFYPKDFTFVCPSEIIAFNNRFHDFKERGYSIIGCSVDNEYAHLAWKNIPPEKGGIGQVQFDLVSDIRKDISRNYDVLFDEAVALRGSFLIDNKMIVRHAVINDLPLGRNIDEMLRMVDALEFFKKNGDVCPANWKAGKEGMKATPEGVSNYLRDKINELK